MLELASFGIGTVVGIMYKKPVLTAVSLFFGAAYIIHRGGF